MYEPMTGLASLTHLAKWFNTPMYSRLPNSTLQPLIMQFMLLLYQLNEYR